MSRFVEATVPADPAPLVLPGIPDADTFKAQTSPFAGAAGLWDDAWLI